ncbi:MAG: FAD-binding protein [Chitinophagaceae bacterium]|nr:FAD-binding protein [Chitinophagaceae bacterium]
MHKRTFLKASSVLAGGAVLSRFVACAPKQSKEHLKNWAGNLEYSTGNVHYPKSVEQVQQVVRKYDKLKALGSRHSFNKIADSTENQVSLKEMNKVVSLDKASNTVIVEGGMRYGELAPYLHGNGYALPNLASLPHISVAGACATATHGSGVKNGNLSTAVSAIEFVNASGELVSLSKKKDEEQFYGAVVGLGALGIVTKVTLDLQPTFNMKQVVYRNLPMSELKNNFDELQSKGYSVSLFTDWKNKNINEVWIKSRVEEGNVTAADLELYGAKLATQNMHPVEDQSAENVTEQMGVAGPWFERMPHFKMGFTPSTGKELQGEYFVPIEHAYEAMMAIEKLHEKITPHLFISEIRTINADNFWMSPCYKKTCVAFHTTWKQEVETVMNLIPFFEEQLAPFNARPHWAKLFTMSPAVLQSRYEKLADFKQLINQYDPKGKFRNEFLSKNLYGS